MGQHTEDNYGVVTTINVNYNKYTKDTDRRIKTKMLIIILGTKNYLRHSSASQNFLKKSYF